MADWAPEMGLYAYAAQNTVVMLNSRAQTVRTMLSGHAGRWVFFHRAGASMHDVPFPGPALMHGATVQPVHFWVSGPALRAANTSCVRPCRVTALAFASAAVPGAAAASPEQPAERLPLLVSAAADRSLRLWNLGTMQRLRVLYKRPAEVTALAATRCLPYLALPCTSTMAPQPTSLVCT